jgi:DnaJ-class molecular chaperone
MNSPGLTYEEYECPICNGTGKEIEKNKDEVKYSDKCFNCDGEGIVYISNTN